MSHTNYRSYVGDSNRHNQGYYVERNLDAKDREARMKSYSWRNSTKHQDRIHAVKRKNNRYKLTVTNIDRERNIPKLTLNDLIAVRNLINEVLISEGVKVLHGRRCAESIDDVLV